MARPSRRYEGNSGATVGDVEIFGQSLVVAVGGARLDKEVVEHRIVKDDHEVT